MRLIALRIPRPIYIGCWLALFAILHTMADQIAETKGVMAGTNPIYGYWFPVYLLYVLSFLTLSVFLYILRSRFRLLYAIIELSVGIFVLIFSSASYAGKLVYGNVSQVGYMPGPSNLSSTMQFLAGVYVVIRGLDNVERALTKRSNAMRLWNLFFASGDSKEV